MKKLISVAILSIGCGLIPPAPPPSPTPTATPTATPEPTSLPTPPPAATPTPIPVPECSLPASTGTCVLDPDVRDLEAEYKYAVSAAQIKADESGFIVGGVVEDQAAYTAEVAKLLREKGYCAVSDNDEVLVKRTNGFSEHYDLVTSQLEVWQRMVAKCRPAFFD